MQNSWNLSCASLSQSSVVSLQRYEIWECFVRLAMICDMSWFNLIYRFPRLSSDTAGHAAVYSWYMFPSISMCTCGPLHSPADHFAQVDPTGHDAWVAGYTRSSLDGHPNAGGEDIFLMKFQVPGLKVGRRAVGAIKLGTFRVSFFSCCQEHFIAEKIPVSGCYISPSILLVQCCRFFSWFWKHGKDSSMLSTSIHTACGVTLSKWRGGEITHCAYRLWHDMKCTSTTPISTGRRQMIPKPSKARWPEHPPFCWGRVQPGNMSSWLRAKSLAEEWWQQHVLRAVQHLNFQLDIVNDGIHQQHHHGVIHEDVNQNHQNKILDDCIDQSNIKDCIKHKVNYQSLSQSLNQDNIKNSISQHQHKVNHEFTHQRGTGTTGISTVSRQIQKVVRLPNRIVGIMPTMNLCVQSLQDIDGSYMFVPYLVAG